MVSCYFNEGIGLDLQQGSFNLSTRSILKTMFSNLKKKKSNTVTF